MMAPEDLILDQLASIPAQESLVGQFVSQSGADAVVDQGGTRLVVRAATQIPCRPGDPVRLEWRGGQLLLIGPSNPRATLGQVTAAGNPATVEYPPGSGVTASLPVAVGLTVTVGDKVVLEWGSGGAVVARLTAAVAPTPPRAPDVPVAEERRQTFTAVDSGSFESGRWWTREVYASSSNVGAYFYGTKIRDTIPDSAQIISASIALPIRQNRGDPPILALHGSSDRPGGAVSFGPSKTLTGTRSGDIDVPTAWLDTLKANDGGIGFNLGGYNIYRSIDSDGNAGAITVTYRT